MPSRPPAYRPPRRTAPAPENRPSSAARGYSSDWQRLRLSHLRQFPLCQDCAVAGLIVAGQHVDHVVPHRGDDDLRLDPANLRTLCHRCHSRKTVRQDGGFGRPRRT